MPRPRTIALSPDGTLAAVGGRWGGLQLVRVADGTVRFTLGHTEELTAPLRVAFSPDGGILVSAGHDPNRVRVWSVARGRLLREFRTQGYPIHDVAIGPAGVSLLATSLGAELWDLRTGLHRRTVRMPYRLPAVRVAASPSGLLAAGDRTGTVRLFRSAPSAAMPTIPSPGKRLSALALSPDGSLVAIGYENGRVRLHHTDTLAPARSFAYYGPAPVQAIGFSARGRDVVVATARGMVAQLDARTGRVLATVRGDVKLAGPESLSLSRDGALLAMVRPDHGVSLWQSADKRQTLGLPSRWVPRPAPRPVPRMQLLRPTPVRIQVSGIDVTSFAVGRRGQFVALAGKPPQVRVYYLDVAPRPGHPARAVLLYRRRPPLGRRHGKDHEKDKRVRIWVAATPDRQWLFAHGGGFYLNRWAFASGRPIPLWIRERGPLRGLLPLHDSKTLLTLSGDSVLGWSLAGNLKYRFAGLPWVYFMCVSPDSKTLVLVQGWDRIAAYDLPSGHLRWSKPSGRVRSRSLLALVIPPGNRRLLTYHENGFLRVYDLALGTVIRRRRLSLGAEATRCAFRPDGRILACAHARGIVYLEIPSGALVGSHAWPPGVTISRVRDLIYSVKGNVLVAQVSRRELVAFNFDRPDLHKPYRGVEALVRLRLGLSIRPPRIHVRPSALPRRELLPSHGTLRHRQRPAPRAPNAPRSRPR